MVLNSNWRAKLSRPLIKPDFSKRMDDRHRFIIECNGYGTGKVAAVIAANQGMIHRELKLMPSLAVELPYFSLEELARLRWVKKVWYDAPVSIGLDTAVPAVGGVRPRELGFTGKGVVVAVLDTGIYPHRDLIVPENRILAWHDPVNQKVDPYDDNGHGTHVAGIIAGNGYSSRGRYKGIAPEALLVGVKVLDEKGNGNISSLLSGIEWCLEHREDCKIKIINLSLGTPAQESFRTDPLCRATTAAWRRGIMVCAAAGNEGPGAKTIDSPGINPVIITVGNVDDRQTFTGGDDRLNRTSGRGPTIDNLSKPDLLAPGTQITSLKVLGGYRTLSGTSMSTPLVSGAVALIYQKWPQLKPDQVKHLLTQNARSLGLEADLEGAGVLDLEKIFQGEKTVKIAAGTPARFLNAISHLKQALGYQIIKVFLEKLAGNAGLIQTKRDGLIKKTLSGLVADYLTPLKQIVGYHVIKLFMNKIPQSLNVVQQKRDQLLRETIVQFIEEKMGPQNRN